ncbi:MAG: HD domain-containing phosphohydrolase [Chloroflexota bacterium]
MAKPLRVLFLEDRVEDAELLLFTLQSADFNCTWQRVDTQQGYLAALEEEPWHIILADYDLPQFNALRALRLLQERNLDIPFVVVTGSFEEVAIECMKAGASDYLLKDRLGRLVPAVERALQEKRLRDEKRQAEESLRESEARFRLLAENATDMISRHSPEGYYLYVSPAGQTLLGYQPEEMLGCSAYDFIHPEDMPAVIRSHALVLSRPVTPTVVYRFRSKQGSYVWFESVSRAILDPQTDAVLEIQVTSRDITQRRKMEDELHESEQRLRTVVTNVPIILFATDRQGLLTFLDGKGLDLVGTQPGGLIGRSVFDLCRDLPEIIRCVRSALAGTAFVETIEAGSISFETWFSSIRDVDDQVIGVIGVAMDVTERRKAAMELQCAHRNLAEAYDATIKGWSRAMDYRDRETEGHTERVAAMTLQLACAMGIPDEKLVHIQRGALLHDMGKMAIPDAILHKPGPLNEDEWRIMRKHPEYAVEMLAHIEYLRPALKIPQYHHEKWDGSGYPLGLKGEEIPIEARIFAIVDVWDALAYDRVYHPAWPREKLIAHIRTESGRHFDPLVVESFLRLFVGK